MKPLPLDALQVFLTLCEHGSLTAASERLHKSPSTLHHSIKKLEQHLGTPLIARAGPHLKLTPAGELLRQQGAQLLTGAQQLQRHVQTVASGWERRLRIAVDDIVPIEPVLKLCEHYLNRAPDTCEIELHREVLNGCWDALVMDRADLVIGAPDPRPDLPNTEAMTLGTVKMVFAVVPHHPLARLKRPLTADDIRQHRIVTVADSAQKLPQRSVGLQPGQPVFRVGTLAQKVEAQKQGLGCGWLPYHLIDKAIEAGELVVLPTEQQPPAPRLNAAWLTPITGKGLHWLVEQLKAGALRF